MKITKCFFISLFITVLGIASINAQGMLDGKYRMTSVKVTSTPPEEEKRIREYYESSNLKLEFKDRCKVIESYHLTDEVSGCTGEYETVLKIEFTPAGDRLVNNSPLMSKSIPMDVISGKVILYLDYIELTFEKE